MTPEYTTGIIEILAEFPESIRDRIAAITGIASRCSYLPTVADIKKMGDEFMNETVEFSPMPVRVSVFVGSPQWDAWQAIRKFPIVDLRDDEGVLRRGWYFPSEWPPKK